MEQNLFLSLLIHKSVTIKEALRQLDENEQKILFVVEEQTRLFGSLTDGDIRRWILNEGSLNAKVEDVCFKDTFYAESGYDLQKIKKEIRDRQISHVPLIDSKRNIKEFLVWDKLFDGQIIRKTHQKINAEVVIMAGGKGTRLDPFTVVLPKPLIPIGDKTILEVIIDRFLPYQLNHFYISLGHKSKIIRSYLEELNPYYSISYLLESKPLGTVGALKQLDGKINKEIFLTNCDIIIDADYFDLLKHHQKQGNDITLVASMKNYRIPYGVCEISNGGVLANLKEKPEFDLLVNTGMYVLNPNVLRYIPENEFFHITDLIEKIKSTHKIGIYPISENSWTDTGEWIEYKKAIEKLKI
jgi:dTDP-glucose pyrophosphorylase